MSCFLSVFNKNAQTHKRWNDREPEADWAKQIPLHGLCIFVVFLTFHLTSKSMLLRPRVYINTDLTIVHPSVIIWNKITERVLRNVAHNTYNYYGFLCVIYAILFHSSRWNVISCKTVIKVAHGFPTDSFYENDECWKAFCSNRLCRICLRIGSKFRKCGQKCIYDSEWSVNLTSQLFTTLTTAEELCLKNNVLNLMTLKQRI